MSRKPSAPRFRVRVECTDVPESLLGVPVSVEVVSEAGVSERVTLSLGASSREEVAVGGPGAYLVRTQLPSGQWISGTTTVPERPEKRGDDAAVAPARLSFGARKPRAGRVHADIYDTDIAVAIAEIAGAGNADEPIDAIRTGSKSLPARSGFSHARVPRSGAAMETKAAPLPTVPDRVELRCGFFGGWEEDRDPGTGRTQLSLRLEEASVTAPSNIALPGDFVLRRHPGESGGTQAWKPLLVRARLRFDAARDRKADALLVWPPTGDASPRLNLRPDRDISENPSAVPVIASAETGNRDVDALFSYVRGNALEAARRIAPDVIGRAESFLNGKVANPLYATLAAYVLLKLGSDARGDWVRNLADWFPFLPDGAILQGWFCIHAGRAEEAGDWFHAALDRGVPMYTEGVRLLHDGLNFLRGLYPDDARIQSDTGRAYRLASVANFDSELTCLSLNAALEVRFSEDAEQTETGHP